MSVKDRKCLSYAVACVYNCVRHGTTTRLVDLAKSKPLLCQLLLWGSSPASTTAQRQGDKADDRVDDPVESWMHLLCRLLLQNTLLGTAYANIASRWRKAEANASSDHTSEHKNGEIVEPIIVNPEQLLLLQLISDDGALGAADTVLWEVLAEDLKMLLGGRERSDDAFLQSMHTKAIDVILGFASNTLAALDATAPEQCATLKHQLCTTEVLKACVDLLQQSQSTIREKQSIQPEKVEHIRSALGLIAALVFRHQFSQVPRVLISCGWPACMFLMTPNPARTCFVSVEDLHQCCRIAPRYSRFR